MARSCLCLNAPGSPRDKKPLSHCAQLKARRASTLLYVSSEHMEKK